ncbi:3-hydroxybutyryl-CoA dehydrogenase [Lipingzhangella halophila]|uniref:3-hydroxybutyryl-CoA dehydrogenase n=2 Tax=Lipingzhangella halophila TaxID=1783352 RepID=A0A7W7W1F1_9ACTN|nr:3-hydroxybutyryl-CoA dehydrogenase [Lipingzhangella halophila]
MGRQIGMVCALGGYSVTVWDIDPDMLEQAREELRSRMDRRVEKGTETRAQADSAFERLTFTTELEGPASTADYVIEAVVEKVDVKRDLFARLDRHAPEHAVLATNSSTIVSSRVADATNRPDRVCNMHFFNPALVMQCVEVVRNPQTSDATAETTIELTRRINRTPVVLNKEITGFVANRILHALRDEAIRLYEDGVSSVEDIDTACRTALGHPMGPFELQDLTGLDVGYYVKMARFEESGDPADKPARILVEKFEKGEFGRKSGKGWYDYPKK